MRAREREESVSSEGSWTTAPTDATSSSSSSTDDADTTMENADDLEDSVATLQEAYHERTSNSLDPSEGTNTSEDETVYRGRIEAVKLTGDPNIPRGEYTFIAPDIGPNGLIRVAKEDMFKGARIVRSVGHIAATGFRDGMSSFPLLLSFLLMLSEWGMWEHVCRWRLTFLSRELHDEPAYTD
jgi:hypothetical protein